MTNLKPSSSGFIQAKGVKLWHEVYGQGEPLVMLPGGLRTISDMAPWIGPLSNTRKVIGIEAQGHGRSADTGRPISLETCADDVAAVLDALKIESADVAGHSFGGDVALRVAVRHPAKVRRLIIISAAFARSGWYQEAQDGMKGVNASLADSVRQHLSTGKFSSEWPQPERLPAFLDKFGKMMGEQFNLSEQVKALPMPVMLLFADHDSMPQKHIAEYFALLGGGTSEPGWQNTKFSRARLAIIPGYSHYDFETAPEVPVFIEKFLTDARLEPMRNGTGLSDA